MPRHRESLEQQAFVQWCRLHPVAKKLFAIPNGGARRPAEAAILKGEGVAPGVPDTMLPVARCGAHGLFVEMKAPNGRESKEQREKIDELVADGYACVVAYDAECAIEATRSYLSSCLPAGRYVFRRSPKPAR